VKSLHFISIVHFRRSTRSYFATEEFRCKSL